MKKRKIKAKKICVVGAILVLSLGILILVSANKKKNVTTDTKDVVEDKKEEKDIQTNNSITIKVGEEIPSVLDYVSTTDGDTTIEWNGLFSKDGKAHKAGTFNGVINYNNKKYNVTLIVVDDEKPTISGVKDITITVGDKVDLLSYVSFKDNSDDELEKKVVGEYSVNKVGTYKLKYEVSDKSGNKNSSSFKLIVKEKETNSNSNSNSNNNSNSNSNSNNTSSTTSKGFKIEKKNGIYYIGGFLIANKTYDLPSTYNPGGLNREFMTAYNKMKADYDKQGFKSYPKLSIRSGFRSYLTQKVLYNNYVARDGKAAADRYSARPGHSEHQTGLAADLNTISDTYGNTDSGKWLANNCWRYGFILRYPKGKESKTGYMYESWHFRYIGNVNVAKKLYNNGNWLSLEEYLGIDSKYSN